MVLRIMIFTLFLLFGSTTASVSQNGQTDAQRNGLKGPVKSVFYTSREASEENGKIVLHDAGWNSDYFTAYDTSGYIVEEGEFYGSSANTDASFRQGNLTVYVLNSQHLPVEHRHLNEDGATTGYWLNEYNDQGQLIYGKFHGVEDDSTELQSTIEKLYDKQGRVIEERLEHFASYYTGKHEQYSFYFHYNNKGQLVKQDGGQYGFVHHYKYDKNGNQIEDLTQDSTGLILHQTNTTYDEQDRVIERKEYRYMFDGPPKLTCNSFKYGQTSSTKVFEHIECDEDGNILSREVQTNNLEGRPIRLVSYEGDQIKYVETYHYQDDLYGNWIQKLEYRDGVLVVAIRRDIKYH